MALFKSSLISAASGSIGGTVYSRNRGGAYTRNRTKPSYSQSPAQAFILSINAQNGGSWDGLSGDLKERWAQYAKERPRVNRLGDTRIRTGREEFLHVNFYYRLTTGVTRTEPPVLDEQFGQTAALCPVGNFVEGLSDDQWITFVNTNDLSGYVIAFVSEAISFGSQSVKHPLRYFGHTEVDASASVVVPRLETFAVTLQPARNHVVRLIHQSYAGAVSNDYVRIMGVSP